MTFLYENSLQIVNLICFNTSSWNKWTSLVAQMVKCLPTMQETQVQSLGQEDFLEKEMATHSSTLAWKILWKEKPGRLQSMGSQRVGHDWATLLSTFMKQVSGSWRNHFISFLAANLNSLEHIVRNHSLWWEVHGGSSQDSQQFSQKHHLSSGSCSVTSVVFDSLRPHGPRPARLLLP